MSSIGGPGGVGGPKGPGGPDRLGGAGEVGDTADVGDVGAAGEVGGGAAIEQAARAAAGSLEALAADIAAGKLTAHEAIDRLVDDIAGTEQLDATERAELRELLTDLVANDPYLAGLAGRA
jgi:hypothetical protein